MFLLSVDCITSHHVPGCGRPFSCYVCTNLYTLHLCWAMLQCVMLLQYIGIEVHAHMLCYALHLWYTPSLVHSKPVGNSRTVKARTLRCKPTTSSWQFHSFFEVLTPRPAVPSFTAASYLAASAKSAPGALAAPITESVRLQHPCPHNQSAHRAPLSIQPCQFNHSLPEPLLATPLNLPTSKLCCPIHHQPPRLSKKGHPPWDTQLLPKASSP